MSNYYEAPNEYVPYRETLDRSLFLAGGITDCPDWQAEVADALLDTSIVVLNPRRAYFPIHDPSAARVQIEWEFRHLAKADGILFWFAAEQIQPVALFELGKWCTAYKPLFVGVDPQYPRRLDVEIQFGLAQPAARISTSLSDLINRVRVFYGYREAQASA